MRNVSPASRTLRCTALLASVLLCITLFGSGLQAEKNTLTVDITSFLGDDQQFANDDQLQFLISVNEPAWLYLYYKNADGKIYQLIPSVLYPENHVQSGDFIPFPAADAPFHLAVSAPYGSEQVWLLATKTALPEHDWQEEDLQELPFPSLDALQTALKKSTRGRALAHDSLVFSTVPSM